MSMNLIKREKASHWYLPSGESFHTVPKVDGSGDRAVTLRDARKVGALPSVTNVLGVLAKPGLDAWKIEQGILAALTLPRGRNEPMDVYARRVVEDMDAQVEAAAAFGTKMHRAMEEYTVTKAAPAWEAAERAFFDPWKAWYDSEVELALEAETVVVNRGGGYAGTVDLIARLRGIGWAIVDYKTQKVKRGPKGELRPRFYETWPLQLAAYRQAYVEEAGQEMLELSMGKVALVSVVVNVEEPSPVAVKVWEEVEGKEGYGWTFGAALAAWRYMKGYDPRPVAQARVAEEKGEECHAA